MEERNRAMAKFKEGMATIGSRPPSNRTYSRFLMEYEGTASTDDEEGELIILSQFGYGSRQRR